MEATQLLFLVSGEVNNLLDDVNARSRVRGVRVTGFQPVPPATGPAPFDTYSYQFVVVGHYHQVASFLTDIASLRRIMVPGEVKQALRRGGGRG